MKVTACILALLAVLCSVHCTEEETFTIMLDSKDFLAHHPERGLLAHHEMEEHIPLLLQIDEQTVMDNLVPSHCEKPEVKFDEPADVNFLQIQSALTPSVPLNPAKPFDMSTILPLAAGAYFLSNGGLSSITGALQQSGVNTNEMVQALPVLLSLGSSLTGSGGSGGSGGGMGMLSQLMPMLAPMLSGGMGGGSQGGQGGMGMQQLMQMAPQLMQMAGGMGGGGGGMGGMGGGGMGGGGMGGMGGGAAMAQLLPMLMGNGGGGGI
eukprot:c25848_g1_i1.p1 GENE.c25848_g1_i1~~c25848_g1_i1.p1  ORF type:complete len:278 (+),score=72.62 c25848_g1_i1:40-834(+)